MRINNPIIWSVSLMLIFTAAPGCSSNGDDDPQADASLSDEGSAGDEGSSSDEATVSDEGGAGLCSAAFPCQEDWIGDGSCDAPCNCEAHNFDDGDCDPEPPQDTVSSDEGAPVDEGSFTDEGIESDEGSTSDEGATIVEDSSDAGPAPQGPIEIAGTWENNFGSIDTITSETWDFGSYVDSIIMYDNEENSMLTMTPDTVEWSLIVTYNMILWTEITQNSNGKDTFLYCNAVFGKSSLEEAASATPVYDNSSEDPFDWTCGDFGSPWTTAIRMGDAP